MAVKEYEHDRRVTRMVARYRKPYTPSNSSDELKRYIAEIKQFRLLDASDERELFSLIERGLTAYSESGDLHSLSTEQEAALVDLVGAYKIIYNTNLGWVVSLAKKYKNANLMPMIDIIQEGNLGLSTAIRRFDIGRGRKFSPYSAFWINKNIRTALADKSRTIRIPAYVHDRWLAMGRKTQELRRELGRNPYNKEIAQAMELTVEEVEKLQHAGEPRLASLNQRLEDSDTEVGDMLPDLDSDAFVDLPPDKREAVRLITTGPLEARQQLILSLRFGIYLEQFGEVTLRTAEGETTYNAIFPAIAGGLRMEDIGNLLGITRQRVQQIQAKALSLLKPIDLQ